MAVTIEDIAKEAGVSIATVSRVINQSKAVSPALCQRVNAVIEKNQFRPNSMARGLITKKSQVIGVVIPDISNPVFGMLVKGINEICHKFQYTLMVCESKGEKERELELLKTLEEKHIDGVMFAGIHIDKTLVKIASQMKYPVVLVAQEAYEDAGILNVVIHDNVQAAYDATKLLLERGHRKIAFLGGPENDYSSGMKRFAGYQKAIQEENWKVEDAYVFHGDFTFAAGAEGMKQILERKTKPTAVLACNDAMAIGAMSYLGSKGIRVPEDISVIGMDGLEMDAYVQPRLSSVEFPYHEEGIKAAEVLIDLIKGGSRKEPAKAYYLGHTIQVRESLKGV